MEAIRLGVKVVARGLVRARPAAAAFQFIFTGAAFPFEIGQIAQPVEQRRVFPDVGKILVFYFACLTLFFIGYAVIQSKFVLYAVYVVNGAFVVFSMALTTYVNRIAPPREHTPTLSMGVAMNHIAAVLMPLVGGLLWKFAGYQWTFFVGATAAALSVLGALRLPRHEPA